MSPITEVKLTLVSKKFLSYLPKKVDPSLVPIGRLLGNPSVPFPESIPRPKVTVEQIEVPCTSTDGHAIPVDVYRPASASADEVLPVLVYL
jgi:acetyl esterase/lipase